MSEQEIGSEANKREPTYGELAVGLTFNPSGSMLVDELKRLFAHVIDHMEDLRAKSTDAERQRLCEIAITEAQTAQMWAVKAATWRF